MFHPENSPRYSFCPNFAWSGMWERCFSHAPGKSCRCQYIPIATCQLQSTERGHWARHNTLGLFVGQHSFCPLHVSLQQLRAPNLTGLLGRGHCGHFGLRTGGGAAGHTGEILSRVRRARAEPTLSRFHHLSACLLEFPGQEFTL